MNDADLELLLYRILSGKIIFFYKNEQYELRSPSAELRYESQVMYNNIINDEKFNEWIREDDLDGLLISLGLWTRDTKVIMKDIESKIDKTKVELFLNSALGEKVKKIRKSLGNLRNQLNTIMNHKNDMFTNTLEGYASSIKHEFIICNTLFKNNKKVFENKNINDQTSYLYFNDIVNEVNKQSISIENYKKLAQSNMWRSYWNCSKEQVFKNAVVDWTDDQRTLVSIAKMYDSVYEHPECPAENIIADDDMLDGWMIYQREKIKKAKKEEQIDRLNPKLKNAQEVFLTPQSKEEITEIMELNSSENLMKIKNRANTINQKGSVEVFDLPDVQFDLQNQMMQGAKNRK
jgi:hypothetical protein